MDGARDWGQWGRSRPGGNYCALRALDVASLLWARFARPVLLVLSLRMRNNAFAKGLKSEAYEESYSGFLTDNALKYYFVGRVIRFTEQPNNHRT